MGEQKVAKPAANNHTDEFANFSAALKKILSVPYSEIQAKIHTKKRRKTKKRSASRAATAKD